MNWTRWMGIVVCGAVMTACGSSAGPGDSGSDAQATADVQPGSDVPAFDDAPPWRSDVGTDAPTSSPAPCPVVPPSQDSACAVPGAVCSYGDDANALCRRVATCGEDSAHWNVQDPEGCMNDAGNPTCPAAPPAPATACSATSQLCSFADGNRCTCSSCAPTGGGCSGTTPTWYCQTPPSQCPAVMPNLGTQCSTEGVACDYGACTGNGWSMRCTSGFWARVDVACLD